MWSTTSRRPALVGLAVLVGLVGLVSAGPEDTREAAFTAVGAGGLKFVGRTAEVTGAPEGENFVVKVPLKGLSTGISLRDRHMSEKYLEVDKYPEALLAVPKSALKYPTSAKVSGEGTGALTLHGHSRPQGFLYTATPGPTGVGVEGTMRININDFGITVPSYLGVTVKPEVDITVRFTAPAL